MASEASDDDKCLVLKNVSPGVKFLTISRKGPEETFLNVSPFLVEKAVANVCGKVNGIKLSREGRLIVETKSAKQASKLMELTNLNSDIEVLVSENERMNSSKGVIFATVLLCESNETILEHLSVQHVVAIERAKRRNQVGDLIESGLFFVTFSTREIPEYLNVGYLHLPVCPFIPRPTQCFSCGKFGHIGKFCKVEPKVCLCCNSLLHRDSREYQCVNAKICNNCGGDHHTLSRICRRYHEQELNQRIRTYKPHRTRE